MRITKLGNKPQPAELCVWQNAITLVSNKEEYDHSGAVMTSLTQTARELLRCHVREISFAKNVDVEDEEQRFVFIVHDRRLDKISCTGVLSMPLSCF